MIGTNKSRGNARTLLINLNRETWPEPVPPVGLAWVAAGLQHRGHDVELLDLTFSGNPERDIERTIADVRPRLIGLSVRNIDSTWLYDPCWAVPSMRRLVDHVRRCSEAFLLLGGSGFSLDPGEMLDALDVPAGIVGEGEFVLPAVADALAAGRVPTAIPDLVHRGSSPGRPARLCAIRDHHAPAHELVDHWRYVAHGGACGVQTKRGCAGRCIYCSYPLLEGARYRLRDATRVVDEIESVVSKCGVRTFCFTDSVFTTPRSHALAVCLEMESRNLDVDWSAYARPSDLDSQLVSAMASAGCTALELGVDAADEGIRHNLQKDEGPVSLGDALRHVAEHGIAAGVYVVLGAPGETPDSARRTLEILDQFPTIDAVLFSFGLRIYRGTVLERLAIEEGCLEQGESLLEPRFYLSHDLGPEHLDRLEREIRERDNWLAPSDLVRYQDDGFLQWTRKKFEIRPLWRVARMAAQRRRRTRSAIDRRAAPERARSEENPASSPTGRTVRRP